MAMSMIADASMRMGSSSRLESASVIPRRVPSIQMRTTLKRPREL